jgi:serine/threonine protein kinase
MTFENGTRIADYEVIAPLGAGGMGQVYKVRNLISDRVEAMKVLLPDLVNEPDLADRFLHEIKLQANLDHPNIAKLYTALRVDNQILMFMEFVEGISLDRRVRDGRIPVGDAVGYIDEVLLALDYAHEHGVVHRDIKPANMMLTPAGIVKLMDFGIAKSTGAEHTLTATGTTLGSLYYMSPEQIQGSNVDGRSDLYSVGVSLYELLTCKKPFEGTSQFSIMSAHMEKTPVPPVELEKDIPPALSELILMSLNRDPAARFQTASAFRNALRSVQPAGAPVASDPAPTVTMTPVSKMAPPRSHRALWMTVGGLCAVLALVALIQFGPRKKISANGPAQSAPPPASTPKPDATPPVQPPAPEPVAVSQPATQTAPVPASPTHTTAPVTKPKNRPDSTTAKAPASVQTVQTPVDPPHAAASNPVQATQPPPPVQPAPVNNQEVQELRDQWTQLDARADSVRSTLQNLQRSQASQGLGLRGDWLQTSKLMDSFLQQANSALAGGDPASAKHAMEKAERQVETLEKALHK